MRVKKISTLLLLVLVSTCLLAGCKKKAAAEETGSSAQAPSAMSSVRQTAAAASGSLNGDSAILPAPVNYSTDTVSEGKSSVQYPVLSDVSDAVNELIKKNAESILSAYAPGDDDRLSMTCEVIALDRSRATLIYQGTFTKDGGDPVAIFCSNTIDLSKVSDITLSDLADTATIASYILSDDCYFTNMAGSLSSDEKNALMEARTGMTLAQYQSLLKNADFPVSLDKNTWYPGCFSFEKDGVIYFTVPVSHELGDYALITYAPETK